MHRVGSGEALVDGLAELLAVPPADPFAADVVAVPAQGVERWLAQRLSHRLGAGTGDDGVCARVDMPSPTSLLDAALAAAGPEHADAVQRWAPDALTWAVLGVLDEHVLAPPADRLEPSLRLLRNHLRAGGQDAVTAGRRWSVARRTAGLLTRYGDARPDLLAAWAAGPAGATTDVPDDLTWQRTLFGVLRERLGPSPAELLDQACAALRERPELAPLPQRLSVVGATRISTARLRTLAALAEHRDVHLWVRHPGAGLWEAVEAAAVPDDLERAAAADAVRLEHPLLASLAGDLRELQQRLRGHAPQLRLVAHEPPPGAATTLLRRLQADLAADRVPPPEQRLRLTPGDCSVQVHACHGRARQVEVMRELVLGLLADDPTLEPRDVLVMCPDVETFAPLVTATFADAHHPAGQLRIVLADRSPQQANPLLALAATLLDLAGRRVTATEVLDLASSPPVRRRFGLDDDDLETLQGWAVRSGVHWGLDAGGREPWGLDRLAEGTWSAGLDRVLLGAAVDAGPGLLGGALPLEDVESAELELAGRLAELVDRLRAVLASLAGPADVRRWVEALVDGVDLLGAVGPGEDWQRVGLVRELDAAAGPGAGSSALSRADVAALLADRLAGRPTRVGFRSGGLTVCTLTPMRSVPHRVVILLGLDDAAFPRSPVPDGEDLLARRPCIGDQDARMEDRQLFLDALLAAGERLHVLYSGWDVRTGAPLSPAVPVGELLDALDLAAVTADGRPAREQVVVEHPLQPFDPSCFAAAGPASDAPFSFDAAAGAGARSSAGPRTDPPRPLDAVLAPAPEADVELGDLVAFLSHPVRAFLRQRLEVSEPWATEEPDPALPLELDGLARWAVADRVLGLVVAGATPADALAAERARGTLPPGPLADPVLAQASDVAAAVFRAAAPFRSGAPQRLEVDLTLQSGRRLVGSVGGLHGDTLVSLTASRLGPKHLLTAWVELLALTEADPDTRRRAVVVGRDPDSRAP
ncbi:MAG TPA: exodeoxyribonuclease V subunit gamma, partial [Motilibacteraceae bacterium]|nr:exodeoxyribonuclease V subunit gamma [Motilibacteraceae bacterium]